MNAEKIRVNGVTMTVIQSSSGRWTAQSGYGYATGATRSEAIKSGIAEVKKGQAAEDERSQAQSTAIAARDAKTTQCHACGVRVGNVTAHAKTAKHKNAIAYDDYQRNKSRRY